MIIALRLGGITSTLSVTVKSKVALVLPFAVDPLLTSAHLVLEVGVLASILLLFRKVRASTRPTGGCTTTMPAALLGHRSLAPIEVGVVADWLGLQTQEQVGCCGFAS